MKKTKVMKKSRYIYMRVSIFECSCCFISTVWYYWFYIFNIAVTSSENLLSVTVDNTLSWDIQVEHVLKKCNTYLLLLSRIKQFLSLDSRTLFYNASILPHLDYCCGIWGNCSRSLEEKIVNLQKRVGR